MKKIASLIICLLFSTMLLCACSSTYENSIISHNYQRDYRQVIATISSITEQGTRAHDENGEPAPEEDWSYTSEKVDIYKSQLVTYINNYGETYVSSYGMAYNDMIDYFVEQLILSELVEIEADFRLEMREIFWAEEDIEAVEQSVYSTIDSYLTELYNEILDKAGKEKLVTPDSAASSSTTYPTKPVETEETERKFVTYGTGAKHDDWYTAESTVWFTQEEGYNVALPGNHGDEEERSLAREGVKRLVTLLYENAQNLINVTDEEKKQIDGEYDALKGYITTEGVGYVYSILGKTLMVKKLFGDTAIASQKMTILQEYIEDGVTISEQEIVDKYNSLLNSQIINYATESAYDSAATGTDMILYRANDNYVYVKHILIPFSDAQTEYLTSIKENVTNDEYLKARDNLVNNIVAYEHVDGEDNTDKPLTVAQIFAEVRAGMARASADPFVAERTFDDYIYKYNTDPGIFGSEYGYAVKYKLGSGESETYMEEFAKAARAFRDEDYKVGQIYNNYVVTDYGVHIMYYAADYAAGETLSLNSYTTPGRYTKVRDKIEQDLLDAATNAKYTNWRDERIYYYRNTKKVDGKDMVVIKTKAFKDLYAD